MQAHSKYWQHPEYKIDLVQKEKLLKIIELYRNEYEFNKIAPFYVRNIKICLNTAVAFKWKRKEYKELCNKIRSMSDFKDVNLKEIHLSKFDEIFFKLLRNNRTYTLKIFLKLKNIVRRNNRQIFENIKNS